MTNPNIETAARYAGETLAEFHAAPTSSEEERATWSRDDFDLHRTQRRDHYLRHCGRVAAALEGLLGQLHLAANPLPNDEDLNRVTLYNEDGAPRTLDEVRAEAMRKAALLDAMERGAAQAERGEGATWTGRPGADAHAEAHRRYTGDTIIDENTGEPTSHDDWGYAECERRAFVAGAAWARGESAPAEPSTPQEGLSA